MSVVDWVEARWAGTAEAIRQATAIDTEEVDEQLEGAQRVRDLVLARSKALMLEHQREMHALPKRVAPKTRAAPKAISRNTPSSKGDTPLATLSHTEDSIAPCRRKNQSAKRSRGVKSRRGVAPCEAQYNFDVLPPYCPSTADRLGIEYLDTQCYKLPIISPRAGLSQQLRDNLIPVKIKSLYKDQPGVQPFLEPTQKAQKAPKKKNTR
mmetsp:Transcript_13510/g.25000  ORF Transcript_13510/g.25000 Transcript_13510/m.25000 type:complete len:209 (-) Transcript_13510:106-732(-)|eukprot:CAMPEP_0184528358 /NCGR_PEP_ID=MMETSP0198_2-20121128/11745_1 /TAXON_ID=1112570 /ORGANISM="Thraustochytrium sp., Strain LLF1b" /LENGTH=208 /DNA_ID=CAMNT_0026920191 /DNA_START=577 /DNA_END=1203 /DNA_ORIENTATION=-